MDGQFWVGQEKVTDLVETLRSHLPQEPETGSAKKNFGLTGRELDVVSAIVSGFTNREIAQKFSISEQTVKNHLHNIFDKLGVSDRLELALCAIQKGLHLNESLPARKPQSPVPAALGTARDVDPQEQRFFLGRRT